MNTLWYSEMTAAASESAIRPVSQPGTLDNDNWDAERALWVAGGREAAFSTAIACSCIPRGTGSARWSPRASQRLRAIVAAGGITFVPAEVCVEKGKVSLEKRSRQALRRFSLRTARVPVRRLGMGRRASCTFYSNLALVGVH